MRTTFTSLLILSLAVAVPIVARAQRSGKGQARRRKQQVGRQIVVEDGVKYVLIPGKPYYHTKQHMDVFKNGLAQDKKVGSETLGLLEKYQKKAFFSFVHFAEVDHKGHNFGENSKEYNRALASAD